MANDRLSQFAVEVLISPTSQKARLSQEAVEVIVSVPWRSRIMVMMRKLAPPALRRWASVP